MAKNYSVFARAYAGVIKRGRRKIEDVRPDELKEDVIELLTLEGLGPDGKPLGSIDIIGREDSPDPKGKLGEPGISPKDEPKGEEEEFEKPIEDEKEDEPTKDTKEKEDKGAN